MTPTGKRGLSLFVILLLLPAVFAAHTAAVTSNSISVYETNPAQIILDIENDFSSTATINIVDVLTSGFDINEIIALVDWAVENNNSIKFSTSVAGISNWGSQKFGFNAVAQNVEQNTTYDWTIATIDMNGEQAANSIQLVVLNDATPPEITATTPGDFIRGTNEELFSVTANDPETAVSGAELKLSNCNEILNPETNETAKEYSEISLTCDNGVCSSAQDLSSWQEGDVCFNYNVHNKGGETANSGDLVSIIDRTAPVVTLNAPDNNAFLDTTSVQFDFTATDNYDTELDCYVNVDGTDNPITANGAASYSAELNDGSHSWSVSCTDEVDLVGTSEQRTLTVDTLAPTITLTAPSVVDRGTNAVIGVEITDAGIGVDSDSIMAQLIDTNGNVIDIDVVDGQITIPTAVETIPGIYTVTVNAADSLRHQASESVQFRIRETFILTLNVNPTQIDASTENNTLYADLTGTIIKDDGTIPAGTVNTQLILTSEDLEINNETGAFATQVQIPTETGGYTLTATYVNGEDNFTATAGIAVGPYCGNSIVNENEECDGSISTVCSDYGFSQGTVSCSATCTIDTSQCSNPPPAPRSSGGRHHSSGGVVYTPPVVEERELISGEIVQPEVQEEPAEEVVAEDLHSGIVNNTVQEPEAEEGLGIGAAWAAFSEFAKSMNKLLLAAMLVLALLLYIFGWRKDDDEWDNYFKRYGHK